MELLQFNENWTWNATYESNHIASLSWAFPGEECDGVLGDDLDHCQLDKNETDMIDLLQYDEIKDVPLTEALGILKQQTENIVSNPEVLDEVRDVPELMSIESYCVENICGKESDDEEKENTYCLRTLPDRKCNSKFKRKNVISKPKRIKRKASRRYTEMLYESLKNNKYKPKVFYENDILHLRKDVMDYSCELGLTQHSQRLCSLQKQLNNVGFVKHSTDDKYFLYKFKDELQDSGLDNLKRKVFDDIL